MSTATLIVSALTLVAALAALGCGAYYHTKDVQERDNDRRNHLRDAIILTALELDGDARTSRILAMKTQEERGYLMPQADRAALKKGIYRLEEIAEMAAEMRGTYLVDDRDLSLQDMERELSQIRSATLEVGEVKLIIEIFTKR